MREENARLKRIVADLPLDKQILQEVLRKKPYGPLADGSWPCGSTTATR
jgi:hypothetical protein